MIVRIVLVGAMLAAFMFYAKQERVLVQVGLAGKCVASLPARNVNAVQKRSQWWACEEGFLLGYPSLELKSCQSAGFTGKRELWYCTRPIANPY